MIKFACAGCGQGFKVKPEFAGKKVKCPKCGQAGVVPADDGGGEDIAVSPPTRPAKAAGPGIKPKAPAAPAAKLKPAPAAPIGKGVTKPGAKPALAGKSKVPAKIQADEDDEAGSDDSPGATTAAKPARGKMGLGVVAAVMGLLGIGLYWVPVGMAGLAGFGLAGLGALIGLVALLMSLTKKGAGIVPAILGVVICGAAVAMPLFLELPASATIKGMLGMEEPRPPIRQTPPPPIPDETSEEEAPAESAPEEPPADEPPAEGEAERTVAVSTTEGDEGPWTAADQPAQLGDVEVKVTSVKLGKVAVDSVIDNTRSSESPLLAVTVELTNRSESRKIDYASLGGSATSGGADLAALQEALGEKAGVNKVAGKLAKAFATLRDNFGNEYKRASFDLGVTPKGRSADTSLYPGKSVQDVLIFEPPLDNAEHLTLTVPGMNFGEKDVVRFRIPRDMIQTP